MARSHGTLEWTSTTIVIAKVKAGRVAGLGFEEPVSSDDLEGLRVVRDRAPADMNIAAGEYGYDLYLTRNPALPSLTRRRVHEPAISDDAPGRLIVNINVEGRQAH